MSDTIDRKRSVEVEKLNDEQLQQLMEQIGDKIRGMVDETCERANRILGVYGLQAKMQIAILAKDQQEQ